MKEWTLLFSCLKICLIYAYILNESKSVYTYKRYAYKGWYTYDVHFEWGWGIKQKRDVIRRKGVGSSECFGRAIFIFLIKKLGFSPMTRYHAESNINILLTRNLPIDSSVRQWTQWYQWIVRELNRMIELVVNLNVIWLGLFFGEGWGAHLKLDIQG